jgi:putative nucleotidyltransferase with HDIG domain
MSLVFAAVLTVVQRSDTLVKEWTPKVGERAPVTLRVPYGPLIVKSSRTGIAYGHARIVIPRGTLLSEDVDTHRVALAFEASRREGAQPVRLTAVFGIFFTLFLLAATYMRRFGNARTRLLRMQLGLFSAMTLLVVAAKALLLFTPLPELWIPLATVPLWVALSFDRRTAFVVNVMLAFMAASLLLFDLPLLTVFITRGLASSIFFRNRKHPWQMVPAGLGGGIVACGLYAAIRTLFEGSYSAFEDIMDPFGSPLLACVGGGVLAGFLGVVLRRPAERLLGGVSRDRLIELTDLDQALLQKMANEAPGSWEHARAMANLAEAAAAAINADSLLTRVGAYYHDLGKTVQPKYFVENLLPGERSPHEELDPDVSADAIMAHVVQGAKILREGGIPEPVVEFAYTHHGTQTIEYFWHKCLERGNPKNLREDLFRYPGMKPQTKETAILMLVDSIEAASRTIQPPEKQKFEEMIQRVVFTKLRSGQLDESGLTLEDVRTITVRMSDTLVNMYHGRIKYPWQREGGQREGGQREGGQREGGQREGGKESIKGPAGRPN